MPRRRGLTMRTSSSIVAACVLVGLAGSIAAQPASPEAPNASKPIAPAAEPAKPAIPAGHPQIPLPTVGQDWPKAKAEDVATVDAIMKSFYSVPAGAPGEARDWNRYRSLFVPEARMIPARPGPDGTSGTIFLPVTEYVDANKVYFEKGGFSDREVFRRVEEFGNIVHVWSTYESRHRATDAKPYSRGINSIQLLKDGSRYWIVNVFWDHERSESPLPAKYIEKVVDKPAEGTH